MSMQWFKGLLATCVMAAGLVACGGGGGDPGTQVLGTGGGSGTGSGSGSGSGTGGGGGTTAPVYAVTLDLQRAGASVANNQISSTETVQAVATVTKDGQALQGVVVSFAESGGGLLKIAPASATSLTDSSGKASVDVSAASVSGLGATTLKATMTDGNASASGSYAVAIQAGVISGTPTPDPAAISFVGSLPSGTAIVVKGAGGTGRAESALLTFRVVDASNTPVNGTKINFSINANSGGATLQTSSAVTNADGQVSATVSSGTQPASIVVTATSEVVPAITVQSDTLIVSNSLPMAGGFEIAAAKFNLDGQFSGDATTLTAFVRDQFGNPVPDGVAVNFQTDFGVVGSSTLGGCTTANGTCTVQFRVQDPRGDGIAHVVGAVRVGSTDILSRQVSLNLAGIGSGGVQTAYAALGGNTLDMGGTCKRTFTLVLADGAGKAPAAGTVIAVDGVSSNVTATVKAGSPVDDALNLGPMAFDVEFDLSSTSLVPKCTVPGTASIPSDVFARLRYVTPNGRTYKQTFRFSYQQ